jgi:hypothetical protein
MNQPHNPWAKANVLPRSYEKFKDTKFELLSNFIMTPNKYMDRYPDGFIEGDSAWQQSFIQGLNINI